MKKSTIWIIASVMGVSLLTLLYLQFRYFQEVYNIRQEQFAQAVTRSLNQTAQNMELYETQERLDHELGAQRESRSSAEAKEADSIRRVFQSEISRSDPFSAGATAADIRRRVNRAFSDTVDNFIHQKELIEEMLSILYEPSDKSLAQRLNYKLLDGTLKQELARNGINIAYHFRVTTSDGREVYRCEDYDPVGEGDSYKQELFPNDSRAQMGVLYVHFPDMQKYIFAGVKFMIPAIIFTIVVIVMFAFTIFTIFRQKRLSEMKNDFINNMTHEFKTPISSISLAAQMLSDDTVGKNEKMYKHLSTVIIDETKRLRFQVEKVLQMSMFEKRADTFKPKEVNANDLIDDVVNTFRLKVESAGGTIQASLKADNSEVFVDEMHFKNVIFNLMDNAVKYKREDVALHLDVTTETRDRKLIITISDNGIGIKKEDLKKIFVKFYRVHTGNRHDIKGFGLGLAYVKSVIDNLDGTIHAESEYGSGTKFIITLPVIKGGGKKQSDK